MKYATLEEAAPLTNDRHRLIETTTYQSDMSCSAEELRALFSDTGKFGITAYHIYDSTRPGGLSQTGPGKYNYTYSGYHNDWRRATIDPQHLIQNCPIIFSLAAISHTVEASELKFNESLTAKVADFAFRTHSTHHYNYNYGDLLYVYEVAIKLNLYDRDVVLTTSLDLARRIFGLRLNDSLQWEIGKHTVPYDSTWRLKLDTLQESYYSYHKNRRTGFNFTFDALSQYSYTNKLKKEDQLNFIKGVVAAGYDTKHDLNLSGIKKLYDRLFPIVEGLKTTDPIAYMAFRSLADKSSKSTDGVKNSVIFNEIFKDVTDEKTLKVAMKALLGKINEDGVYNLDSAIKKLPLWLEKRKAVVKGQAGRAFGKLMQDYDFLKMDEEAYPITTAAIKEGELPIGTFFRKSEQYFLLNDNWELWEEMLTKHKDIAIELANEVKGRTTYEKDLMSYFYFVLHELPEYLKKMTGKKWTGIPKIVNSENELEPPEEEGGVARKRSALTPTVDNDNCTVEVPYASLAISGYRGTTYCYSHNYSLLKKGLSINGNVVTKDFESKLNGKDDYGLMFYTLTGSEQGRGYPTFLIIFERRKQKGDVKVHFHRTHPSRSKDGDYNPIHNWTKVTFNWMAGNVNKDLIKAQQGDLFFVDASATPNLTFNGKVNSYDKHTFEKEVEFAEYDKAAKSNILGYVRFNEDKQLKHTEHDDIIIPAGTYAIHQCRSWEANPKGVWSLRID